MNDHHLDVLMITCDRPEYTRLSLRTLLDGCDDSVRVWVWQNGTDAATRAVVQSVREHPRLHRLHLSEQNVKLRQPTNWFWRESKARFLGKVDDDCLVPPGWANRLIRALERAPDLGMLACWHFYDDDFVPHLAARKTRQLSDECAVLLNCWVQGSGYVMRREVVEQLGPLGPAETFTDYGVRAALAGWHNGWHLPLIHEEHMDDPRSPYCRFTSEEDFRKQRPLSAVKHGVETLEEWRNRARWMARSVQAAPYNPLLYTGWRAKVRSRVQWLKRQGGWREPWRMQR